jgi:uncharacterized membrane protein
MDLDRLTTGEKVMGISGILLFVFSFFKWLGYDYGPFSASASAWSFTLAWVAVILGILVVAYVVLRAMGTELPKLGGITWAQLILIVTAVVFVFILIKLIAGPSTGGVNIGNFGISKSRKIGIFLGLLASIGMVVGAYLNVKEAGDLPDALGGKKGDTTPPPAA